MKKTAFLILISMLFISCGQSKEEKTIADYVQTLDDTKMDLKFKMLDLEKVREIKTDDSLKILRTYFEEKRAEKIEEFQMGIESNKKGLNENQTKLAQYADKEKDPIYESLINLYKNGIENAQSEIERYEKNIELYEGDCKGTFLEPVLLSIKEYEQNPDKILAIEYKANFSVINPMLNNTKQEITRNYILNPERTKVIQTVR